MKFLVLAGTILFASAASAAEMQAPAFTISHVDWAAAAASLADHGNDSPSVEFGRLNALTDKRFAGIAKSTVPVLLPIDLDAFRADVAAGNPDALTSNKYFGFFRPSNAFLPGPAGYFATFLVSPDAAGTHFARTIEVSITGGAYTYDLDGPDHQEVFPAPKEVEDLFPGILRILREAHVHYVFERFGVPYVISIQCYDTYRSRRFLSCREADPIAVKFLRRLRTAGGSPQPITMPQVDLTEPDAPSDFSYFSPGYLIPDTGARKMPGRADYHVYADMRFPIANAPAYVKSQSFMPWGDCYRSGRSGRWGSKDASYSCRVNGIPLVFNEAAAVNFSYPWRDNFCERRDFLVGQCPSGYGHQGEDIRPASCTIYNEGGDRCLPYEHTIAAVRDGLIWRNRGNLAAYIVVNTANDFVRFRYLHMNPKYMDQDGLLSGRTVSQGEIIGKVATWGDKENGTSYHLHFNMQVFTKVGWVWVNPYMSLVLAYERLIGGRGTEIKPGDPVPPVPIKLPHIAHPDPNKPRPVARNDASAVAPDGAVPLPPEPPDANRPRIEASAVPGAIMHEEPRKPRLERRTEAAASRKHRHRYRHHHRRRHHYD